MCSIRRILSFAMTACAGLYRDFERATLCLLKPVYKPRPSWPCLSRPSTPIRAAGPENMLCRRRVRTNAEPSPWDGRNKSGHDGGAAGDKSCSSSPGISRSLTVEVEVFMRRSGTRRTQNTIIVDNRTPFFAFVRSEHKSVRRRPRFRSGNR
jgi:hypothetical protein